MTKIDESRPDILKIHEIDKDLAKEFISLDKDYRNALAEYRKAKKEVEILDLKKEKLFIELNRIKEEEIEIISPDGNLMFEIEGEKVFIMKGKKENPLPEPIQKIMEQMKKDFASQ